MIGYGLILGRLHPCMKLRADTRPPEGSADPKGGFLFGEAMTYIEFLEHKAQYGADEGFAPTFFPHKAFDFQRWIVDWSVRRGRCGNFYDCGLGKTLAELAWGQNVIEHTNKPVLCIAPLAVSAQTVREGEKFGIDCVQSRDGVFTGTRVITTNYERLHYFNPGDFGGVICDESSAIKAYNGKHRAEVTEFLRTVKYRSLWTATAAPNDYIELGTSSEALGELGQMDMLTRFFKNDQNNCSMKRERANGGKAQNWRFKGHAEQAFWRWVASWARAARRPSDLGYEDGQFILPQLIENEHIVKSTEPNPEMLFNLPAANFREERIERRKTVEDRCEKAASLVKNTNEPAVVWCHLNDEGDLLEKMLPDFVQVSGSDSDDMKEETYLGFLNGSIRGLVIKPRIGCFGLNWQHCAHTVTFASHSYEQYYQAIRRFWRFGQKKPVTVDIVISEGEGRIRENMKRKEQAANVMFTNLVAEMNNAIKINRGIEFTKEEEIPSWL